MSLLMFIGAWKCEQNTFMISLKNYPPYAKKYLSEIQNGNLHIKT